MKRKPRKSSTKINQNLIPDPNNTHPLGSSPIRFQNFFLRELEYKKGDWVLMGGNTLLEIKDVRPMDGCYTVRVIESLDYQQSIIFSVDSYIELIKVPEGSKLDTLVLLYGKTKK